MPLTKLIMSGGGDDLKNYEQQLQQVEAALLSDPVNAELLQLKNDLTEIISLTRDLINVQDGGHNKSSYVCDTSNKIKATEQFMKPTKIWNVGDKCSAKWNNDGVYNSATIENITESGEVLVMFDVYQNRGTSTLKELRAATTIDNEAFPSLKRKRNVTKEYLKQKQEKKRQRMEELEEDREKEKNNWLNFNAKGTKKKNASNKMTKKSIFATTELTNGRVGVGTCGVSGKPMTQFTRSESYRKWLFLN